MADYRWNLSEFAVAYDESAEQIHPWYREIQTMIVSLSDIPADAAALAVDLGGGSGRLIERFLDSHPHAVGVVVDQSDAFLALAERKLERFGKRAICVQARLQDDWRERLPSQPAAIVSMSAIHHLEPAEKQSLYAAIHDVLAPGGAFLNGDEVRPDDDGDYLRLLHAWGDHMRQGIETGRIAPLFRDALDRWHDRNITRFSDQRHSGDDCLETIDAQLAYLRAAGFKSADCPWERDLWAILSAVK